MTATLPVDAIFLGVTALYLLAWLARYRACTCPQCSFHQNQARMERLRKDEQKHEDTHRMWGVCWMDDCPRNKKRK